MERFLRLLFLIVLIVATIQADERFDEFLGKYQAIPESRINTTLLAFSYGGEDVTDEMEIEFFRKGAIYHHRWTVPSRNYSQDLPFKFGEERLHEFNGTKFTYMYIREAPDLIRALFHIHWHYPVKTEDTYTFTNDTVHVVYRVPQKHLAAHVSFQRTHRFFCQTQEIVEASQRRN